jgi:hypothetical protein
MKKKAKSAKSSKIGNIGSAASPGAARPWTAEEMKSAKPYPLPTVEPAARAPTQGVPHVGKGQTEPAGLPEDKGKTR